MIHLLTHRYIGENPKFAFQGLYEVDRDDDNELNYVRADDGVVEIFSDDELKVEFEELTELKGTSMTEPQKLFSAVQPDAPRSGYSKHDLLADAVAATADRGLNYGKPEDNFARIAAHWNAFLFNRGIIPATGGGLVSPSDVAIMCALLKIARLENQPNHKDSWVDLAGYAACGAEIAIGGDNSK